MNREMPARLLGQIHSPKDLRALPEADLPRLAAEIREELITVLSQTGGHLGPNLGVVELTIALHRVFETPKDKFVFDVSHQGYVHKLLTGRADRFSTIRQYEGLNGFLLRSESEHDCYGAGHAGTALSAALGMAVGRDLRGTDEHVVCIAGDAAFTCGVSFEALNNVANSTDRLIVVLNDNEWSIAKNVGAIAEYLSRIVTNPAYAHLHEKAAKFVEWLGGKTARMLAGKFEAGMKNLLAPSVIFEDLGFRYYGPIDGHDIPLLTRTFEFLKTQTEPVILHILTKKGKGYAPALAKPDKFHGLGKFEPDTGETAVAPTPTYSELLGRKLAEFADRDNRVCAITAAMPSGTGLFHFAQRHPKRFFDVGIAEEHAALFACGLATQGMKPFLAIYSTFMQRAYDMIIHDIALQNLDVALCMDRAGLSGDDGPTHHGLSTSATSGTSRALSTCSRRTRMNSSTCCGPWPTTRGRSPFAIRAAPAPEQCPRSSQSCLKSERRRSSSTASRSRFSGLETCANLPSRPRNSSRPRASTPQSSTRAGSSRSTPRRSNFLRAAARSSARSRITCCTTDSAAR